MTLAGDPVRGPLLRRGFALEYATLAAGKARTGAALANPVLRTEGQVTLVDGILATAVLLGLVLNAADQAGGHISNADGAVSTFALPGGHHLS